MTARRWPARNSGPNSKWRRKTFSHDSPSQSRRTLRRKNRGRNWVPYKDPQRRIAAAKVRYRKNRERILKRVNAYYETHKEERRRWREANRERILEVKR